MSQRQSQLQPFSTPSSPKAATIAQTSATKKQKRKVERPTMASSTTAGDTDVPMTGEQHDKFVDTVGRIVLRVNMAEGHEGSPDKKNAPLEGQGPLTAQELSELSLLCTLQTTLKENDNDIGFANVEGDQLSNLIELLDEHVNLAVGAQIICKALEVMKMTRMLPPTPL